MPMRLPSKQSNKQPEFLISSPRNNLQVLNQGKSGFLDGPKKIRYPQYIGNVEMPGINLDTFATNLSSKLDIKSLDSTGPGVFDPQMSEFDPVSGGNDFPVIPSFDPVSTAFNIASIGLKIFGGIKKSEAERQEADEIQRYYNDLAAFEEKQATQTIFQIGEKSAQLQKEGEMIIGEQQVQAAAGGYTGKSLDDLSTISAMSLKIDKELLKSASQSLDVAAREKAEKLRLIGERKKKLGYDQADMTTLATAGSLMFGKSFG